MARKLQTRVFLLLIILFRVRETGLNPGGYGIKDFHAAQKQGPKTIQFTCQTPLL